LFEIVSLLIYGAKALMLIRPSNPSVKTDSNKDISYIFNLLPLALADLQI